MTGLRRRLVRVFGHRYLSTSCLHDRHDHCRCEVGVTGDPKIPGTCKWCPAKCICRCHKLKKTS